MKSASWVCMARYTFRMKGLLWLVVIGALGGIVWLVARWRRQYAERQQAAEARLASFIAQAAPSMVAAPVAPVPAAPIAVPAPQERLLLDAAAKAGEAGEPVLSIQLYAKLLSRYPQTQFASQARAAVEAQKKKLAQA
jgi:hypothetical protein